MNILTIENKTHEKFLRQKTALFDFTKFSRAQITDLLKDMREIMRHAPGIGLAANQVGLPYRVFVAQVGLSAQAGRKLYAVFNPEIMKYSSDTSNLEEGCLSVPKTFGNVERSMRVDLRGFDRYGKPLRIQATGLLARVFQHEVDHLNGKLFLDKAKDVHVVIANNAN